MTQLPDDIVHKIQWCEKLLNDIADMVQEFADNSPTSLVAFADPNLNSNRPDDGMTLWQLKTVSTCKPPAHLTMLVGDFVQNLRSSLDYLARAVVIATGGTPVDKGAGTSYPILLKAPKKAISITGCDHELVSFLLEGTQPYRIREPMSHPLARLNFLANEYKHRELRIAVGLAAFPSFFALADRSCKPFRGVAIANMRFMSHDDVLDPLMYPFTKGVVPEAIGEFVPLLTLDTSYTPIVSVWEELNFYLAVVRHEIIPSYRGFFDGVWPEELRPAILPQPYYPARVSNVDVMINGMKTFYRENFGEFGDSEVKVMPMYEGLNTEEGRGW